MRKLSSILVGLFVVFSTLFLHAQDVQDQPTDFFVGEWKVLVEGTPNGDVTMILKLERKDGKLIGTIDGGGQNSTALSRVEEKKDKSITAYFKSSSGYDVYLFLEKKKSGDTLEGSMMDMFDATAKRAVTKDE